MNRSLIVLLAVTSIAACSPGPVATTAAPAQAAVPAAAPGTITGTIAETMNSGGYTYARVQATPKDVWIASTELPIKIGDRMTAAIDMPMENFNSKTLNRSFPLIYFVSGVTRDGEARAMQPANGARLGPIAQHAEVGPVHHHHR